MPKARNIELENAIIMNLEKMPMTAKELIRRIKPRWCERSIREKLRQMVTNRKIVAKNTMADMRVLVYSVPGKII